MVAESTEIFFPIDHLGCFIAFFGLIFLNLLSFNLRNGPPEAVIKIFSILFIGKFLIKVFIEKCSESIATNSDLYLIAFFFIKSQPQIIASLFAIRIFLLILVNKIVGSNPAIPGMAETVTSIFFIYFEMCLTSLRIVIFLSLHFFFTFM